MKCTRGKFHAFWKLTKKRYPVNNYQIRVLLKIEWFVIGCEEIVDCIGNQVGRGGVDVESEVANSSMIGSLEVEDVAVEKPENHAPHGSLCLYCLESIALNQVPGK